MAKRLSSALVLAMFLAAVAVQTAVAQQIGPGGGNAQVSEYVSPGGGGGGAGGGDPGGAAGELAFTGFSLLPLVLVGLVLILGALALRRRHAGHAAS